MKHQPEHLIEITRHLAAIVYASFLAFLLFSAYGQGLSHFYADMAIRSGSETEMDFSISHQPGNPEAHERLGLIRLRNADFSGAATAFERAISFRQNDFLLWLRLGYARQGSRDLNGAANAYRRGIELAPRYSQPHYYMGMMLLEAGRADEGFAYLSRAAEFDLSLYPEVLRLARKTFSGDAGAIEKAVSPEDGDAKLSLARYLIKYHFMTDSVRAFLLSEELADAEKNDLIRYLLHKKNFELAREVWFSRLRQDNLQTVGPLYDGGFESIVQSDPSGLGWQIDQKVSATAVARDSETVYEGESSIRIKFAGNVELARPIVSQLAFVKPGRRYVLRFVLRSTEMISAGLPEIGIIDGLTNQVLARSTGIKETRGEWLRQQMNFTSTDSPVVLVSIQRGACGTSPCPIFGDLSLDDLELLELTSDPRQPISSAEHTPAHLPL